MRKFLLHLAFMALVALPSGAHAQNEDCLEVLGGWQPRFGSANPAFGHERNRFLGVYVGRRSGNQCMILMVQRVNPDGTMRLRLAFGPGRVLIHGRGEVDVAAGGRDLVGHFGEEGLVVSYGSSLRVSRTQVIDNQVNVTFRYAGHGRLEARMSVNGQGDVPTLLDQVNVASRQDPRSARPTMLTSCNPRDLHGDWYGSWNNEEYWRRQGHRGVTSGQISISPASRREAEVNVQYTWRGPDGTRGSTPLLRGIVVGCSLSVRGEQRSLSIEMGGDGNLYPTLSGGDGGPLSGVFSRTQRVSEVPR